MPFILNNMLIVCMDTNSGRYWNLILKILNHKYWLKAKLKEDEKAWSQLVPSFCTATSILREWYPTNRRYNITYLNSTDLTKPKSFLNVILLFKSVNAHISYVRVHQFINGICEFPFVNIFYNCFKVIWHLFRKAHYLWQSIIVYVTMHLLDGKLSTADGIGCLVFWNM